MNGDKDVVAIYDYIYQATIETFEWEILKKKNIKNLAYHFFNDMINIGDFDWNLLKIDKKS